MAHRPLIIVAALTVVGAVLRLLVAHEALFADELSTYWIVTEHSLPGVVRTVHTDAEITPPLYFVLAWGTTLLGEAPELVRGPSLIAGVATIPLMYALGRRTIGQGAALVAAALTTVAPFAVYYSSEARAYGLMMALVIGSTLALLTAIDTSRRRWWVVYAACSAAAMYSHYTCAFLLAAQAVWALVHYPEARRPVLLANAGAAVAFAPWVTGLLADFDSPTTKILDQLAPFTAGAVRVATERWSVGYPGSVSQSLGQFPGVLALSLLAVALLLGLAGVRRAVFSARVTLVVLLALAVPVGEILASFVGTNLVGTRNLTASWPALMLGMSALVYAAPGRLRVAAVGLAGACFAIGAVQLPSSAHRRPDVRSAVNRFEREAGPGSVLVDATGVLSPGPPTPVDAMLTGDYRVVRAVAPAERDHPFNVFDPIVPMQDAIRKAVRLAHGDRVWLITTRLPIQGNPVEGARLRREAARDERFPPDYRMVGRHVYDGVLKTTLRVYARRASR